MGTFEMITDVENEERVLRGHDLRGAVVRDLGGLFVPPNVTSGSPRDFTSRPLQDKDVLYDVGLSQSGISDRLGGDRLSTPSSLIRGDQNPGLAIVNSITEGFRRETSEDDRVYGTNTCAGEESSHGLPVHGKIDADGVTLLDTEGFENVGDSAYFAQEFGIGDVAAFAWLVGFVDNGSLWEVVSVKLRGIQSEVETIGPV